jgi:hypothetical protein
MKEIQSHKLTKSQRLNKILLFSTALSSDILLDMECALINKEIDMNDIENIMLAYNVKKHLSTLSIIAKSYLIRWGFYLDEFRKDSSPEIQSLLRTYTHDMKYV